MICEKEVMGFGAWTEEGDFHGAQSKSTPDTFSRQKYPSHPSRSWLRDAV